MTVEEFVLFCKKFRLDWQIGYSTFKGYYVQVERIVHQVGDKEINFSLKVGDPTLSGAIAKAVEHIRMRLGIDQ